MRHIVVLPAMLGNRPVSALERRRQLARRRLLALEVAAARREHDVVITVRHDDVEVRRKEFLHEEFSRQQEEDHAAWQAPANSEIELRCADAFDPLGDGRSV